MPDAFQILLASPYSRRDPSGPPLCPEAAWLDRRALLRSLGYGGLLLGLSGGCRGPAASPNPRDRWVPAWDPVGGQARYPAPRGAFPPPGRATTPEDVAARHNNFYEFLPSGGGPVHRYVGGFTPRPWRLHIGGEVDAPRTIDVDEIARIAPFEERVYRFRCVEAWSMVVPWTGIPLRAFIEWCRPKSTARYVSFVSFGPGDLIGEQKRHAPRGFREAENYPWPFYEALRLDEALHPLAFLATGIYGHGLPMQHGAPLRVVVPWKYGYKSPKSIVRVQFTTERPRTFWNDLYPGEYSFLSNVDPGVPHPRWSQATERDLATGDVLPTLPFNGYAEVGTLYRTEGG